MANDQNSGIRIHGSCSAFCSLIGDLSGILMSGEFDLFQC
ncbi:hypothetical protein SynA1825c_00675 [Synechococcus sp. A18-25c]|nr:hypothetical protein SynA1825c_00675 [Synechococcus sp. A18-25c]